MDREDPDRKPDAGRPAEAGPRPGGGPGAGRGSQASPSTGGKLPLSPFAGMVSAPVPSIPRAGGAVRGIGEKLTTNLATGTASFNVPIATSPGRAGFQPTLALDYGSGIGNGAFGAGWNLSMPHITRRTDHGLPRYDDREDSDVFILSGMEDLVPLCDASGRPIVHQVNGESVVAYRPRVESAFARIERHEEPLTANIYWTAITRDNVTSVYGKTAATQIVDPRWPRRIFTWLLEQTIDDRGQVIVYEYKPEDLAGVVPSVSEQHRLSGIARFTNRYLKRIRYGNTAPGDPATCVFEVVFDYGEHDPTAPAPEEATVWPARQDPFSTYRPGFEVRSYRLCRRVLMFHKFTELGTAPCLVASTVFGYDENTVLTKLSSVTHIGYIRDPVTNTYTADHLPPLTFDYSPADLHTDIRAVDRESLQGLPAGVDGSHARWVDLDGEGLPGVLLAGDDALAYKQNLGGGVLAPARTLPLRPRVASLSDARHQLVDLDGDGRKELAMWHYPMSGFHERTDDDGWTDWKPFRLQPMFNVDAPMVRFIDLTGDGREDLIFVDDVSITWFPSLGRGGYGHPTRMSRGHDEDHHPPRSFYNDETQAILFADMTGDGLSDIVRVKNGSVCYWPNLGYGVWGAKVTLANVPQFDRPNHFDPKRILLGNIDGSGTTDILYAHPDGIRFYANQSGNALAPAVVLPRFPSTDTATTVSVVDLLGTGTSCLVWSSPHLHNAASPMQYVDLHQGVKPHLLTSIDNGLGLTTSITYTSSTQFYLADLQAGRRWLTKLPFPVQVVSKIENYDAVSMARLVRTYAYHHGYYDGVEREFRGFGMVEERDAESFSGASGQGELSPEDQPPAGAELTVPPAVTKTWFHTGYWSGGPGLDAAFAAEYFPGAASPPTAMPSWTKLKDAREAARALKGQILRQEVYAEDGSKVAAFPYAVSTRSYEVRFLQSSTEQRHASFFTHARETIDYHLERKVNGGLADDPRITHGLILEVDPFGAVLRSAAVAYPRNPKYVDPDRTEQAALAITISEADVFNSDPSVPWYRLGVPLEERAYELTGLAPPASGGAFPFEAIATAAASAVEIPYEMAPGGSLQKRLLKQVRHTYWNEDLSAALDFGAVASRALPYRSYAKAFTAERLAGAFGARVTITAGMLAEGGYVQLPGDPAWWLPSGRQVFSPAEFFQPVTFYDPFDKPTYVTYEQKYHLLVDHVTDPVGNVVQASYDTRVLAPSLVTDPNDNQVGASFDALGRVVAVAIMGKGPAEGDTRDDPTTTFDYAFYDKATGQPSMVHMRTRETHRDPSTRWQHSYSYTDGSGHEVMRKVQAAPAQGTTAPRWVGTGRTVFDNKGNPVKKYEPYFSATSDYEDEPSIVMQGVTPILHYDPLGRLWWTDLPNGTFSKVVFDAWQETHFDPNDTLLESRWYQDQQKPGADPREQDAAAKAAAHANTPSVVHLDPLGRHFLTIEDNGQAGTYPTRTKLDIEGNALATTDARGVVVQTSVFAMNQQALTTTSCDAGQRWTLNDVMGQPYRWWDARGTAARTVFDELRRATQLFVQPPTDPQPGSPPPPPPQEMLAEVRVYGEQVAGAKTSNLCGRLYQVYDGAGAVTTSPYDFKGNLLTTTRQVTLAYQAVPDWSALVQLTDPAAIAAAAQPSLDPDPKKVFTSSTAYDALNRPTSLTAPDGSVTVPAYNEASQLKTVSVSLPSKGAAAPFVTDIQYNEKGQRLSIAYASGVVTEYSYEQLTFRLSDLITTRTADNVLLQKLHYTYDPVGNICEIDDAAQPDVYYNGALVTPNASYVYDAIYRLVQATGRELAGGLGDAQRDQNNLPLFNTPHPNDVQAVRNYTESYVYDAVGNIQQMAHQAIGSPMNAGTWTRRYLYETDPADPTHTKPISNRLVGTSVPGDGPGQYGAPYGHDAHGNMISMPHMPVIGWDFKDQMQVAALAGGGNVYFMYDAAGQRVRKVWEHSGLVEERIYVGGYEVYEKRSGSSVALVRRTLHVMDGVKRIALVETTTADASQGGAFQPSTVTRFQFGNHLGSSMLEVDEAGAVISYEEYHPYGTTAYSAGTGAAEASLKRYRYTGKERDEETGLYYYGARYYAPWLARWTSADPAGTVDGPGLYNYVRGSPVTMSDPNGAETVGEAWEALKRRVVEKTAGARGVLGQVGEGFRRYEASKPPPLERLKDFFLGQTRLSLTIHPDEITPEMVEAAIPPLRALKQAKRVNEALKRGDYAAATEAALHERDAVHETLDTAAGIVAMVPEAATNEEAAVAARAAGAPKLTPLAKPGVAANEEAAVAARAAGAPKLTPLDKDLGPAGASSVVTGPKGTAMLRQPTPNTCGPTCARQLLSESGVETENLRQLTEGWYKGMTPEALAENMNRYQPGWKGFYSYPSAAQLEGLSSKGKFIARVGGNPGHFVIVDKIKKGTVYYRDPEGGVARTMAMKKFEKVVSGVVFRP